ncbi:Fructose-1,6-bisphosphatase class 3 [compost metagenome]
MIYNSFGLLLVSHEPFESTEKAIKEETDILSSRVILETAKLRQRVRDTDIGVELNEQISDLNMLLYAYKNGLIKEKSK